jgi:peptide/nickel transport system substrate-binding protein
MAKKRKIDRRNFLVLSGLASASAMLAACQPKVVEKVVKETVEVEKVVKETVEVEKEVTRVVEEEKVVEKVKEEGIKNVPRERTVVIYFGGSGGTWPDAGVCNPYAQAYTHQNGDAAAIEGMEYYSAFGDIYWPWLAEDHEYNDDLTELTVHIRKGVEWSDGEPFTAEDVAFTLNTVKENVPLLRNSTHIDNVMEEATAVDDYTCVITFNQPSPRFYFEYLTFKFDTGQYIVPKHIYEDVEDWTEFNFFDVEKGWPVVTGPYEYTYFTNTQKFLDRRDDWWAAKTGFAELPEPERILAIPMADEAKAIQLGINNTYDACLDLRPSSIKTVVEQNPAIITHSMRKPPYGYIDWWPNSIGFNDLEYPFNNPDIRWALSYVIDRQQAIDVAYDGAGIPTKIPFPDYASLKPFRDSISDLLEEYHTNEYNLEKSAELMEENGWAKDSEGFWAKDGQRFSFFLGGWQIYADIGPIYAEQFRRGGFEVEFGMPADHSDNIGVGKKWYAWLFGHGGSVGPDPFLTLDLYSADRVAPTGESGWGSVWRWKNEAYTEIVDEMSTVPMGDPKVMELFHDAMEIWLRELPSLPVLQWMHRIPMNTTYWTGWPTEENEYLNGAFWHLTFPRILDRLEPVQ